MFISYLEARNLLLDIVSQVAEACAVGCVQSAQLALEGLLVQNLADAHTATGSLVTVAGADTLTSCANLAATEALLLKTIDNGVEVEADVRTVRDEDALTSGLEALGLELSELLEEARNVDDGSGTNEVDT